MFYSADNMAAAFPKYMVASSQHALRPDTLHLPFSLINASLHKQVFLTAETIKSGGPFPNETCNKQNLTVQTVF